jgi:hypothetical protein
MSRADDRNQKKFNSLMSERFEYQEHDSQLPNQNDTFAFTEQDDQTTLLQYYNVQSAAAQHAAKLSNQWKRQMKQNKMKNFLPDSSPSSNKNPYPE